MHSNKYKPYNEESPLYEERSRRNIQLTKLIAKHNKPAVGTPHWKIKPTMGYNDAHRAIRFSRTIIGTLTSSNTFVCALDLLQRNVPLEGSADDAIDDDEFAIVTERVYGERKEPAAKVQSLKSMCMIKLLKEVVELLCISTKNEKLYLGECINLLNSLTQDLRVQVMFELQQMSAIPSDRVWKLIEAVGPLRVADFSNASKWLSDSRFSNMLLPRVVVEEVMTRLHGEEVNGHEEEHCERVASSFTADGDWEDMLSDDEECVQNEDTSDLQWLRVEKVPKLATFTLTTAIEHFAESLQVLDLSHALCRDKKEIILPVLPNLLVLNVSHTNCKVDLRTCCPRLRSLSVRGASSHFLRNGIDCPRLVHLDVSLSHGIDDAFVLLLRRCPRIRWLFADFPIFTTLERTEALADALKNSNLTFLSLNKLCGLIEIRQLVPNGATVVTNGSMKVYLTPA